MKVRCTVLTHPGNRRSINQDCVVCGGWLRAGTAAQPWTFEREIASPTLFAVADGLGGHAAGELASLVGLAKLEAITTNWTPPVDEPRVAAALQEAHTSLLTMSEADADLRGMGTTVAGVVVGSDRVLVFNVGDSRVYRREDKYLQLMSKDDRYSAVTYGEASTEGSSNALLQYLGVPRTPIEPHVTRVAVASHNETFLICTDGLHDLLSQDELEASMSSDHQRWVQDLLSKALTAGGIDNISILALDVTPMGPISE